jgi:RHS repeat-associated protein
MRSNRSWPLASFALVSALGANAQALDGPSPGALTPSTLTLPSSPASIRGLSDDPSVSVFSGEVSYSLPIDLPKAAGGFAPTFSLAYDGARGNGPLGVGWNVDFPRIRRSERLGVPTYTASDELELVGLGMSGRLRNMPDGTLRVEGAGQSVRVQRSGNAYIVTDVNGVKYFMGVSAVGRQGTDDGRIAQWLTQSVIHPNGQSVAFDYTKDQNEVYLSQLRWGPSNALVATLGYSDRPDVATSYRRGFKVVTQKRLSTITVQAFGSVLRTYRLGYDDSFPLSRLTSVAMSGRVSPGNAQPESLPPVTFAYQSDDQVQAVELRGGEGWTPSMTDVALVDVDGDGLADLTRLSSGDHRYWRNLGGEFGPSQPIQGAEDTSLSAGNVRLMDMDGDARTELVRSVSSWQVYRLQQGGWQNATAWGGTQNLPVISESLLFADLNGDGRTEPLERSGSGIRVRMNQGASLASPVFFDSFDGAPLPGEDLLRFQDANGDELADAIRVFSTRAQVFPGLGNGRFDQPYDISFPFTEVDPKKLWLADLNRDGVLDVVHVDAGEVTFYPANTDGSLGVESALPRPPGADASAQINLADVNGNGSVDVVWSTLTGMWCLDLAGASRAAMLAKVDNGMGKTISFAYRASTELALEDELAGRPWSAHLPVSIPVTVESRQTLASGDPARLTTYQVRDGFYDEAEHRFGGFRRATTIVHGATPQLTEVQISDFIAGLGNDRVLRGKESRRELRDGNGKLFAVTIHQWSSKVLDNFPIQDALLRVPRLNQTFVQSYEGEATAITTRVAYRYDGEGNQIASEDYGRTDLQGDEVFTQRKFAKNDTTWVRGAMYEEIETDAAGKVIKQGRTYFDGTSAPLPLGQVDKGWARRVEAFLVNENRWLVASETVYDRFGNIVSVRDKDGSRDVVYDADGLFPVQEIRRSAGGNQSFVWTSDWDRVLGQPLSVRGPDGVLQELRYDSLGRQTRHAVDGIVDQIISYDWTRNTPRTTTYLFDGDIDGNGLVDARDTRTIVQVSNSAGQPLFHAMKMADSRWLLAQGNRYDQRGKAAFGAESVEWLGSELPNQIPANAVGQSVEFDALGRVVAQTLPNGDQKRYVYGRFSKRDLTPDLAPVDHTIDGLGRVIETKRVVGGVTEGATTAYDPEGHVLAVNVRHGAGTVSHTYAYDSLGRLLHATDPDVGQRRYSYDDASHLVSAVNATGQRVSYTYDSFGRVATISGDGMRSVKVHYDVPRTELPLAQYTTGRPAWLEEGSDGDRVEFAYDRYGRVSKLTRVIDGQTATESTEWAPSGLTLSRAFDDGFSYDYTYDHAGRVLTVGDLWQADGYDASGRVLAETYGNGLKQTYQRNVIGYVERTRVFGASTLLDLGASYNRHAALRSVSDNDGLGEDHTMSFEYDAAARLSVAHLSDVDFSYAYDDLQNMTKRKVARGAAPRGVLTGDYHYGEGGAGPRQLTSIGAHRFVYDAAGRMLTDGTNSVVYDAVDRALSVQADGDRVDHHYGYDGGRTRTIAGDYEERVYSPHLTVRGDVREHNVKLGDRLLARVDFRRSHGGWVESDRVYHHSTFGDGATLLTDAAGQVLDERRYEPFGAPMAEHLEVDRFGWNGKPTDQATGWADHGARWYAFQFARWMAPDPVAKDPSERFAANPWDLNPYQFVRQNPNVYRDPDGRDLKVKRAEKCTSGGPARGGSSLDPFPNIRAHGTDAQYRAAMEAYTRYNNIRWFEPTHDGMQDMARSSGAQVVGGKVELNTVGASKKSMVMVFGDAVAKTVFDNLQDALLVSMSDKAFAKNLGIALTVLDVAMTVDGERLESWWNHKATDQQKFEIKLRLVRQIVAVKGSPEVLRECYTCRDTNDRAFWLKDKYEELEDARYEMGRYRQLDNQLGGKKEPTHPTIRATE